MADDGELIEIKLHSSVPTGSIRRMPHYGKVRCMYNRNDNSIIVYAADNGDYSGTWVSITSLATLTVEYSFTSTSKVLDMTFPLYDTGYYRIEVVLPTGETYSGEFAIVDAIGFANEDIFL